jgi:hypothetical protein
MSFAPIPFLSGGVSGLNLCDDSMAQTKHWALVITSTTMARIVDLTTPDVKKIYFRVRDFEVDHHLVRTMPMHNKYPVGLFEGHEDDFDLVLRHHPARGLPYSSTFNNCQHFVANFLLLLKARADTSSTKSFQPTALCHKIVNDVTCSDNFWV